MAPSALRVCAAGCSATTWLQRGHRCNRVVLIHIAMHPEPQRDASLSALVMDGTPRSLALPAAVPGVVRR